LPQNKDLLHGQRNAFWDAVIEARTVNGESSPDQIVGTVVQIWINKHLLLIQGGAGFGLGGMMRTGHAKVLLHQQVYTLKALQMGGLTPSKPLPSLTQTTIKKQDIGLLSYRDAGAILKNLQMKMHRTLGDRRAALKQLFEGQHPEYSIAIYLLIFILYSLVYWRNSSNSSSDRSKN
jgi:hypothetical protein